MDRQEIQLYMNEINDLEQKIKYFEHRIPELEEYIRKESEPEVILEWEYSIDQYKKSIKEMKARVDVIKLKML